VTVTNRNGTTWSVTRTKPKTHSINHPVTGAEFTSWAECYLRNGNAHPEIFPVNTTGDPNALYTGKGSSVTYPGYTRGALALVIGENVPGTSDAGPAYEWLHGEFVRSASSSWKLTRKWAIVPDAASVMTSADLDLLLTAARRVLTRLLR
jgi:hypothetical protein